MLASKNVKKLEILAHLPRNSKNLDKMPDTLRSLLGYDFEISSMNKHWFSSGDDFIRQHLGQVETPAWVVNLISKLCITSKNDCVLDPCFGNGIFLNAALERLNILSKNQNNTHTIKQLYGVEIDPFLFVKGLSSLLKNSLDSKKIPHNFFNGDIFDFENRIFDVIIFNPPYIRQEDLSNDKLEYLNKEVIAEKSLNDMQGVSLSARSNLYSYFIVHLTKSLSESGHMGIIVPKVWLDSKYGKTLQEFLLNNYEIQYIIDFDRDTFSKVIVEDCILVLKKSSKTSLSVKTKFVHIKKKINNDKLLSKLRKGATNLENDFIRISTVTKRVLLNDSKWGKFLHVPSDMITVFENRKLVPLHNLADVNRGITTNWNNFFMQDDEKLHSFKIEKEFLKPIVKSPKDIKNFDTNVGTKLSNMLFIERSINDLSDFTGLKEYIKQAIASFRHSTPPITVKRMIDKDPDTWYCLSKPKSGQIIFSYIIRQMKNFIYNSKGYLIRDNFYAITPKRINPLLIFGVLNSSLVKLNLELIGRRYGNGLLKIQAYELAEMLVPDVRLMTKKHSGYIQKAAKQLVDCKISDEKAKNLIKKIDMTIHEYLELDINPERIGQAETQLIEKRLCRVGNQS